MTVVEYDAMNKIAIEIPHAEKNVSDENLNKNDREQENHKHNDQDNYAPPRLRLL